MNLAALVAVVLAAAVALGVWRMRSRRVAHIGLQALATLLLYLCLFPPATRHDFAAGELFVLTPGATAAQRDAVPIAATAVALPGVDAARAIERVPDLATALRRHPDARRLRIVGGGLPVRDRDAARGLVVAFDAAPLPPGLVELDAPVTALAGQAWSAAGRVEGDAVRVELRDPSGTVVAAQAPDADGRFALDAVAKGPGLATFELVALGRDGARLDASSVAVAVSAGEAMRIALLAGAPDVELKYLRRWAVDAGLALDSRIALTEGVALIEGSAAFDAAALREADLAILDERSWAALDAERKQALLAAVRDGLGLLLRVTGPVAADVAADWSALGLPLLGDDAPASVKLEHALGSSAAGLAFTRHGAAVAAADAATLLHADDDTPLGWSREVGRGRVALWRLADSHRLVLAGASAAFGSLWSEVVSTLARPRGEAAPSLPARAYVGERTLLCGLATDATVETADAREPLLPDAAHCAAYWPQAPGVHELASGDRRWPFTVRAANQDAALRAGTSRRATQALVDPASSPAATSARELPLSRWPFFLALLAALAALWVFERRMHGGTAPG